MPDILLAIKSHSGGNNVSSVQKTSEHCTGVNMATVSWSFSPPLNAYDHISVEVYDGFNVGAGSTPVAFVNPVAGAGCTLSVALSSERYTLKIITHQTDSEPSYIIIEDVIKLNS